MYVSESAATGCRAQITPFETRGLGPMRLRHCRADRVLFAQPQPTQLSRSVTELRASGQLLMAVGGQISMTVNNRWPCTRRRQHVGTATRSQGAANQLLDELCDEYLLSEPPAGRYDLRDLVREHAIPQWRPLRASRGSLALAGAWSGS